ncbi:MPT63 family protein [Mycobacterium rhizamassiliense]|uniref:MPT63 family protein n=1 Tax=Mycobacterium rhizamassiliense TaxID=1841860 RepID=UPI00097DA3FA|nr:MPT63 family protein [Mycobacterium rhizamassiliense]
MKFANVLVKAASFVVAGVVGLSCAVAAGADDGAVVQQMCAQGTLFSNGVVQGWTVLDLEPSKDVIPADVRGALWEAAATDQATAGDAAPLIPNFSARAPNGDNYRALFEVPTQQGISPSGLPMGQSVTGKLYFDVTGQAPDSVVFNDGRDRLIWRGSAADPAPEPVRTLALPDYKPASLSVFETRTVYLQGEVRMRQLNDRLASQGVSPEERARFMFERRNALRTWARALMSDRAAAAQLDKKDPNVTFEYLAVRNQAKGLSGDALYNAIITRATRSRISVNESLGIDPDNPPPLPPVRPSSAGGTES